MKHAIFMRYEICYFYSSWKTPFVPVMKDDLDILKNTHHHERCYVGLIILCVMKDLFSVIKDIRYPYLSFFFLFSIYLTFMN
jgi:hypothetical protein